MKVGHNVRISAPGSSFVEPAIAASPLDSLHMVAAAIHMDASGPTVPAVFASADGGRSWTRRPLPFVDSVARARTLRRGVDPWVSFSPDGRPYLSALLLMMERWHFAAVFQSPDQGRSWPSVALVEARRVDHPIIFAEHRGPIFLQAAIGSQDSLTPPTGARNFIGIFRSTDGGRLFTPAAFIGPSDLFFEPNGVIALPDGVVLAAFRDFPLFGADGNRRTPVNFIRLWAARSVDSGRTFSVPHLVGDVGTWDLVATPQMRADLSPVSRFHGRVYVAWNDVRGHRTGVAVTRSQDSGLTWSLPVLVGGRDSAAVFSALAVSNNGTLGVAWLSEVRGPPGQQCWQTRFAASVDGGVTFSRSIAVSDSVSCLTSPATRAILQVGYDGVQRPVLSVWARGGDYMTMTVDAAGAFHPVWIDARDGDFAVYTARIVVSR